MNKLFSHFVTQSLCSLNSFSLIEQTFIRFYHKQNTPLGTEQMSEKFFHFKSRMLTAATYLIKFCQAGMLAMKS